MEIQKMRKFSQLGKSKEDNIKEVAFELSFEEQLEFEYYGKLVGEHSHKEKIKKKGKDMIETAWERVALSTGRLNFYCWVYNDYVSDFFYM